MKRVFWIVLAAAIILLSIPVMAADYVVCTECGKELWENEPYIYYVTDNDESICLCSFCIFQSLGYTDRFLPASSDLHYRCDICGDVLDPNLMDFTWIPLGEIELSSHAAGLYDQDGDEYETDGLALDIELFICDLCLSELREPFGLNVRCETPESTAFSLVGYNKYDNILSVTFRDSNATYQYKDFPYKEWIDFCNADSLGSYFNEHIKNNYEYEKVE